MAMTTQPVHSEWQIPAAVMQPLANSSASLERSDMAMPYSSRSQYVPAVTATAQSPMHTQPAPPFSHPQITHPTMASLSPPHHARPPGSSVEQQQQQQFHHPQNTQFHEHQQQQQHQQPPQMLYPGSNEHQSQHSPPPHHYHHHHHHHHHQHQHQLHHNNNPHQPYHPQQTQREQLQCDTRSLPTHGLPVHVKSEIDMTGQQKFGQGRDLPAITPLTGRRDPLIINIQLAATLPSGPPRTITPNMPVDPADQVTFFTEVDLVMKELQSKPLTAEIVRQEEESQKQQHSFKAARATQSPKSLTPQSAGSPGIAVLSRDKSSSMGKGAARQKTASKVGKKRYRCTFPGCHKSFPQKTHLDIHRRSHTGEKPYVCSLPGYACGKRFTQLGNLRTHERRHTGERPYKCDICGKAFAQGGNMRAHQRTHLNIKPYVCQLDNCNKSFTTPGNLKMHQNKFHIETLKSFRHRLATLDWETASEQDRMLMTYFAVNHKNCNKGIKGRGKNVRVGTFPTTTYSTASTTPSPVVSLAEPLSASSSSSSPPHFALPHIAAGHHQYSAAVHTSQEPHQHYYHQPNAVHPISQNTPVRHDSGTIAATHSTYEYHLW